MRRSIDLLFYFLTELTLPKLTLFFLVIFPFFIDPARGELVERIVAIVGHEVVLESDVKALDNELKKEVHGLSLVDDLLLFGKPPSSLIGKTWEEIDFLVNEKILNSEIKRLSLSISQERVDQELRGLAKRHNLDKNTFLKALRAQGVDTDKYIQLIKSKIERQGLIESEISSRIRLSDEEILALLVTKNPKLKNQIYEYAIANIFINSKKNTLLSPEARMDKVITSLRADSSPSSDLFESLAEKYSEDPNFSSGGLLGSFRSGELSPEFEAAITPLKVGQISSIVRSKNGLYLLKLVSKKMVPNPSLEEQKENLRRSLFDQALSSQLKKYLLQKKEDLFVKINTPS